MEFSFPGDYWFEVKAISFYHLDKHAPTECVERATCHLNLKGLIQRSKKGRESWFDGGKGSHPMIERSGQTCKREWWNHESHQTYLSRTFLMQVGCIGHQLWDPPESTEIILVLVTRAAHKGNLMPCHAMPCNVRDTHYNGINPCK